MADSKISALTDGSPSAAGDALVIARSGASDKIVLASPIPQKLYDYTVAGSDKASIDTGADGTTVANFGSYDVLEVWVLARTDDAGAFHDIDMVLNNDSGAHYDQVNIQTVGSSASGAVLTGTNQWQFQVHGSGGSATYASALRITIPAYRSTTFYKAGEATGGVVDQTTGNNIARSYSLAWRDTSAITRIKIAAESTAKLKVGSRLIVYGR